MEGWKTPSGAGVQKMGISLSKISHQLSVLHSFGVAQNFQLNGEGLMAQKGGGGDHPPPPVSGPDQLGDRHNLL